ncbi:MAG: hypothetical protein ABW222_01305 [Actinomycetota bacterium]
MAPERPADEPGQRLDDRDGQGRQHRHGGNQEQDVEPIGPAEQEHVGASAGDVQHRLGDDEAGQREQLGRGPEGGGLQLIDIAGHAT